MTTPLLEVQGLSVSYGKVAAVRNVSLTLPKAGVVTVIGANGAGKTTLLNAIMGILPSAGRVALDGESIAGLEAEDRVRVGLCLAPEKRELFSSLSVEDNLMLGAYRFGARQARDGLSDAFARFPRLEERRRQLAGTLSGGERQMLAMGRALMTRPSLLMLDEPSLGLAPRIVKDIFRIIQDLRGAGVAVLLVEQNARAALQVADYAYVMELGEISMQGPAADLARDDRVIESYLGLAHATERRHA